MNYIISVLLSTRLLTFFTGSVTEKGLQAYLTQPELTITAQDVRIKCRVANAYPTGLRELAKTGTPVSIYLFAELTTGKKKMINRSFIESKLVLDLVEKRYLIIQKEDTSTALVLDSATTRASQFHEFAAFPKSLVKADQYYLLRLYAVLGKVKVEALKEKSIDLMYYWDFKRPSIKTERIPGRAFLTGKK